MNLEEELKKRSGGKKKSSQWYINELTKHLLPYQRKNSDEYDTKGISPGNMYMFTYIPGATRPGISYDSNPLVFVIEMKGDKFFGINLHHVNYQIRKMIAKSLLNKVDITSLPRDCYRLYFTSRCSNFIKIPEKFWVDVSSLPTERFQNVKGDKNQNWVNKT